MPASSPSPARSEPPLWGGFIAPVEGTTEDLVVDGTIATVGLDDEPAELEIGGGHLRSASGAERAADGTAEGREAPRAPTSPSLGSAPAKKATLSGEILEDEKLLGTAHVAFGASAAIGGTVQVGHLDCLVLKPDVAVDGQPVVRDGALVVWAEQPCCSPCRTSPRAATARDRRDLDRVRDRRRAA